MGSMHISLPDSLKDFVQEVCNEGDFSNPSDFVRELIRDYKQKRAQERLEQLLLEGLNSGLPVEANKDYLEKKRTELINRHKKKNA